MLKLCIMLGLCSSIAGHATAIDGDTLKVEDYRIRLAGIDAEEMLEPNGPKARAALQFILNQNADLVDCQLDGNRSYDRYIATCTIKGVDIGIIMVSSGYALDCAKYSGGKYRSFEPPTARQKLIQKPYCKGE